MTTQQITQIPLNQLVPAPEGVRKTKSNAASIAELAADIKAHGLMQNLVVRLMPQRKGAKAKQYGVIAGQRRLAALTLLAKEKHLTAAHPVPCRVETADAEASVELSLAENFSRESMHPADQFDAFRKLVDQGLSTAEIAARFGRPESAVVKLLRLSRLSPKVLKAYRAGELALEQVQAFAVTEDHKAQERVLEAMYLHEEPADIRATLTEHEVPVDEKRVKFLTRESYEKAGGKVREDLFAGAGDEENPGAYIQDVALLDQLVGEKLQRKADALVAEGWKWAEVRQEFDYSDRARYQQLDPYGDRKKFTAAEMARAGVVVKLGWDGKAELVRGLVRKEDAVAAKQAAKAASKGAGGKDSAKDTSDALGLSKALVGQLTAQKSAALAAELIGNPRIALAALVHQLALDVLLEPFSRGTGVVNVTAKDTFYGPVEGSLALKAIEEAEKGWLAKLPKGGGRTKATGVDVQLWDWCLTAPQGELLGLLAFCVARMTDCTQLHGYRADDPGMQQLERVATAVGLDMRQWWKADEASYFGKVGKPQLVEALRDMGAAGDEPEWLKIKRADLAKLAAQQNAGNMGWLPEILRVSNAQLVPLEVEDTRTLNLLPDAGAAPGAPAGGDPKAFDGRELPPDPTVGKPRAPRKPRKPQPAAEATSPVKNGTQVVETGGVSPADLAARDEQVLAQLGGGIMPAAAADPTPEAS